MFAILWFLFIAFAATVSLVWILDHNGVVLITWLGYEAKTDILTALLIAIFFATFIFAFSYLLARILAMKFPNIFKLLFKKSYVKRLENLIHRHWSGIDVLSQLLLSLENEDVKTSQNLQKKLSVLIKNPQLNNFFLGKISYQNKDFSKASEFFSKIIDNKFAHLMVLKSKFELALEKQDNSTAIAYAKQILSLKKDSSKTAAKLLSLYRTTGAWQEAKALINEYGIAKFGDDLKIREVAAINSAIAFDFYYKKNFRDAIKYAKIALKADENFLPAREVLLKSWVKRGFGFYANYMIKKMWKTNPHLIFAEIFDLTNRKKSPQKRISAMKKLVAANNKTHLNELALGIAALRSGSYKEARDFLQLALLKESSYRTYKTLGVAEKMLGDNEKSKKYFEKAETFSHENHYICSSCNNLSSSWKARCGACGEHNSFEWSI